MKYIKPLDGYRALAVGLVIFEHWLPPDHFLKVLPYGFIGVTMFFVLSGFLITSILLKNNDAIAAKKIKPGFAFKTFYIRRTLRIFPVYYLLLIGFCIFYPKIFSFDRSSLYWFFTYSTNIYAYIKQNGLHEFRHLWSLAVEEQFYLLWPLIVLFSTRKHHFRIILSLAIGAFLFRLIFAMSDTLSHGGYFDELTPACLDSFAAGAILSLFYGSDKYAGFVRVANWLAAISLLLFVITRVYYPWTGQVMYRLPVSIMSLWLLIILLNQNQGIISQVFSNRALVFMGKISYGIYLFHYSVPEIYSLLSKYFMDHGCLIPFTKYSMLPYIGGPKQLVLYFAFLMAVASVSWYCFERPINNLKRYFDYKDE